jgi:hypothetical protein
LVEWGATYPTEIESLIIFLMANRTFHCFCLKSLKNINYTRLPANWPQG